MLLVFDIGNTNIVVGCFEGKDLKFELRLKTDPGRTVDEYLASLHTLFQLKIGPKVKFQGCVISSVVPPITPDVVRMVKEGFSIDPLIVGPGIKTGLPVKVTEPHAVGADRIVNAVAAKTLFGTPSLVIDFGTATSFDYVSPEGNYEGGVIAPGPLVALESLVRNTAKLPRIELVWPKSVVGRNTISAMQVGAVMGYACMVDGLIEKFFNEVGEIPHVIATGGLGKLFAEHCKKITRYEPHLTLQGLQIIFELNSQL